jgi:hypothetical protein
MFTKTRRECIPAGSGAASLLLTVLVIMSVSCTKPSRMALGVGEIGTAILVSGSDKAFLLLLNRDPQGD